MTVSELHPTAAPAPFSAGARKVLIVGGGIAGVEALMALADLGDHALRVRVVAADPAFVLRPQTVGEPWGGEPLHIDLERLCRAFGAEFTRATVGHVDQWAHRIATVDGTLLEYDRLLLAPGAHLELPYTGSHALGVGPLPPTLVAGHGGSVAVVVPPGTSWTLPAYELALLAAQGGDGRSVRVITPEAAPLEAFGPATREPIAAFLHRHGVTVEFGRTEQTGSDLRSLADIVVALPVLRGPRVTGLPLDANGFVPVDGRMAVRGIQDVYAAGDAIDRPIKQGGLAGQEADIAAIELVRSCGGHPPAVADRPMLRGVLMIPGGEQLYLRRALDAGDDGYSHERPLWHPPGVVCAWRLARWLSMRRGDLESYSLDHVAQTPAGV